MDVLILAAEDSENRIFGVIPVEMNSTFLGIQQALLKRKSDLPPVENPEINLICAEYANVLWVEKYVCRKIHLILLIYHTLASLSWAGPETSLVPLRRVINFVWTWACSFLHVCNMKSSILFVSRYILSIHVENIEITSCWVRVSF